MRTLDIGIVGCGTAGSAAAIFLARQGHDVTIYERVPNPGPVGAGITLQPTGLHVLARLGLHAQVVAHGAKIERLVCETEGGRRIVDLAYETVDPSLFGLGLHRGVLFDTLHDAATREPRVSRRYGIDVAAIARADRLGGRSWIVDESRERHGPHELIVVADGARSRLRDVTSMTKRCARYPWGALWFVAEDPALEDPTNARVLHQIVRGNQRFLGMLPTGLPPSSTSGGARPLVSLFWSIRGDEVDAWRRRGLDAWTRDVSALSKRAARLIERLDDPDQVLFAAYQDVVMHRWSARNVVYLGDAAHATSPQLGQGCNLALWDAMVLADAIAAEERHVMLALDAYDRARRDHLAFYQLATRWLTPFFQGDRAWLGALRDAVMPRMAKVPLLRRIMTTSMIGVVDGFGGRTLELSLPSELRPGNPGPEA